MILKELLDAYILDKPAGASTHTPDGGLTDGFLEMASKLLRSPLWAVHRLDTGTSGCLLVTTTQQNVDLWTQKLARGKKKYVFVSKHNSKQAVWSIDGRIEKVASHQFALVDGEPNSKTTFAKLGPCGLGFLYEAEISTGKTHQIRIHAQASGVSILGDPEYGGDNFFRIMLHAKELELDGVKTFSPLPKLFEYTPSGHHSDDVMKFLVSYDRRRFLINFLGEDSDCLRLVHREWATKKGTRLAIEKLGPVLQVLSYFGRDPEREFMEELCQITQTKNWFVRQMFNRGSQGASENIKSASKDLPLQWTVKENKMKFDLRYSQGLSSGLFLDQRVNRERVHKTSQGKRVANFFSYTCGFSVAAALGGASEVVSIDTSSNSLQWGKDNFKLNGLDPEQYEFFTADAIFFLNSCVKRERQFDLIILDPPTFSRSKHGSFRIKEDLQNLLTLAFKCLDRRGTLFISTNDESLKLEELSRSIEEASLKAQFSPLKMEKAPIPYDFEFPLERDTVMKGFWVSRI